MQNSTKIQKISKALHYACLLGMGFWVIFLVWTLINIAYIPDALPDYMADFFLPLLNRMHEASLIRAVPAALVFSIPNLMVIYIYWRMALLFKLSSRGIFFSEELANHLLVIASLRLVTSLISFPLLAVSDYILTIGNSLDPAGMPFQVNGDELSNLVVTGTFIVVAWIMREGIRLKNENEAFV